MVVPCGRHTTNERLPQTRVDGGSAIGERDKAASLYLDALRAIPVVPSPAPSDGSVTRTDPSGGPRRPGTGRARSSHRPQAGLPAIGLERRPVSVGSGNRGRIVRLGPAGVAVGPARPARQATGPARFAPRLGPPLVGRLRLRPADSPHNPARPARPGHRRPDRRPDRVRRPFTSGPADHRPEHPRPRNPPDRDLASGGWWVRGGGLESRARMIRPVALEFTLPRRAATDGPGTRLHSSHRVRGRFVEFPKKNRVICIFKTARHTLCWRRLIIRNL